MALLSAIPAANGGCSAIFVQRAPGQAAAELPQCSSSLAAPIADSVVAVAAATLGATALGATVECNRRSNCAENLGPAFLVLGGAVFAGATASAIYGFHQTGRCRQATVKWCSSHDCGPFGAESPPRGTISPVPQ